MVMFRNNIKSTNTKQNTIDKVWKVMQNPMQQKRQSYPKCLYKKDKSKSKNKSTKYIHFSGEIHEVQTT